MRKMLTQLFAHTDATDADVLDTESVRNARPKRKRVVPIWRLPQTIALGVVLVLSLVGGASLWAWNLGYMETALNVTKWKAIKVSSDMGFTVQDVLVSGRAETSRDDLLDALAISRGSPILAYDFLAAKERVEALPWVLRARIERLLPDTLAVHIIERRPIALWQSHGEFALIDETGEVITRESLGRFSNLIHVVGEDAPDNVGGLLELLETQPELKALVKAAVRVGGRRWDLSLNGDINVRLPAEDAPKALARLAEFEQASGVLARDIRVLDLRMPDRVIVRRSPTALHRPERKPGQET